ncbi:hypothetical protein [Aquimarina aquimarini]|uniref:hypothetical protein n=1 Tax=Aquimarina aquimarini TaxID=1191734 RepID=UPI000D56216B|nr:hypothetical protein [Aquimarina aquimarini]
MTKEYNLKIVNQHLKYDKVSLIPTLTSSFIHIASEIDTTSIPFFITTSSKKKELIKNCKKWSKEIEKIEGVIEISFFKATIIPPGFGQYIKENLNKIHLAKFDFVILIETLSDEITEKVKQLDTFKMIIKEVNKVASFSHIMNASNVRRIGSVNHKKKGVFLFNYFSAENRAQNLKIWEYTAGWFEKETALNNSTLMLPKEKNQLYSIVNHCRWDKYIDILPSLIFKKSFKNYVLDNFYVNNLGAQPILYKVI